MRRFGLVLLVLLLSACGPQMVTSNVTRFNSLPLGGPQPGRSFTIVAEGNQVGSLEFQQYASVVQRQLEAYGFKPVPPDGRAVDYVVHLDYGIDGGRTHVWSEPSSPRMGFGFGRGHRRSWSGMGIGVPLGGYDDYGGRVRSYTSYGKFLEVEMIDGAAQRAGRVEKVFEGRAIADTTDRDLPAVVPYLATALFTNFPGANGQTVKVQVPVGE